MTEALRPGTTVWRINQPHRGDSSATRCQYMRALPGGQVKVRASTFSRNEQTVRAEDVYPDRDACRAEIQRRANAKEPAP